MVILLVGENSFEIERSLKTIIDSSKIQVEKYDGSTLEVRNLPDLLMGGTLFAAKRLVVIKNLSENSVAYNGLNKVISRLSDDIDLVLVETKPDKRSAVYKNLVKISDVKQHDSWGLRDSGLAIKWLEREAEAMGLKLDTKFARLIVDRVGVDQWQLFHALEKLVLAGEITRDVIESVIEASPVENVFNLLETALVGDSQRLASMLANLEATEDPGRLFALLSSQVFQLATVASASADDNIAGDFGVHPYVVSRMKALSKKLSRADIKKIIKIFAKTDDEIKSSSADMWVLIEIALQRIAAL